MRKLLIPLLAALALPTAVNAETWYLMAYSRFARGAGATTNQWTIPTSSNQECEEAGQTFLIGKSPLRATGSGIMSGQSKIGISSDTTNDKMFKDYVCVKGK